MTDSHGPLFPQSGEFMQSIRDSCRRVRKAAHISIERSSIERLLLSPSFISSFRRVSKSHGLAFPLQFPSVVSELNLLAVLALLNFASGYRVPLHEQTGRGAWDNMRALAFGMFITSTNEQDLLSARGMKDASEQKIAELLGVNVHIERPHEKLPGVTIGELGGPIYEIVRLIVQTLNETGEILLSAGYPDLGTFTLEALKEGQRSAKGTGPDVDKVLEHIVRAIPGFRDMALINGEPVYVFKKALFLIHAINIRFGSVSPSSSQSVPIPDTSSLPVFSDNVLPSILIHLGVLDITAAPKLAGVFPDANKHLDALLAEARSNEPGAEVVAQMPAHKPLPPSEGPALSTEQAYILRAAAIDACEMIVEIARSSDPVALGAGNEWIKTIALPDLDMWLWAVAKDRPDYRKLERFVLRNTVMF
ncbi:hypothetical protein BD410DRAFT_745504 [Rickenella mellea]|uniref:Queuosine 5'-phosphate N-glycosylase/hydrolase n=1 Tax=Rickenella mellea TaxID=50990 RepID=A0A4Y7Q9B2_9AGAM|nr:hypothetical protein BD410DRAFT_745504 [Rickenella mellea]